MEGKHDEPSEDDPATFTVTREEFEELMKGFSDTEDPAGDRDDLLDQLIQAMKDVSKHPWKPWQLRILHNIAPSQFRSLKVDKFDEKDGSSNVICYKPLISQQPGIPIVHVCSAGKIICSKEKYSGKILYRYFYLGGGDHEDAVLCRMEIPKSSHGPKPIVKSDKVLLSGLDAQRNALTLRQNEFTARSQLVDIMGQLVLVQGKLTTHKKDKMIMVDTCNIICQEELDAFLSVCALKHQHDIQLLLKLSESQ